MTKSMFMLFAFGYYTVTIISIVLILFLINKKHKKNYVKQINNLERQKNMILSASIVSELKGRCYRNLKKHYILFYKKYSICL